MAFFVFARSFRTLSLAAVLGLCVVSCSPDMFSEEDRDKKVGEIPSYRNVRESCSGLKLSESVLGASEFRGLLSCLNGNGNLQAMVELTQKVPDEELAPVVHVMNQALLGSPAALYAAEKSLDHMEQSGILDPLFTQLGSLLEYSDVISSGLEVLKVGYQADPDGFHWLMGQLAEWLGQEKNLEDTMDAALMTALTPAYSDLQNRVRCAQGSGQCHSEWDQVIRSLLEYTSASGHAGERLLSLWAHDAAFAHWLQETVGTTQEQVRKKIWNYSSLLAFLGNTTLPSGQTAWGGLAQLFFELHGKDLTCLRRSIQIKDPDWFVLRELLDHNRAVPQEFLGRFVPLSLLTLSGFCDLGEKASGYPSLVALSQHPQHLATLMDALVRADEPIHVHKKSGYLLQALLDAISQDGVLKLTPAWQSLSQRDLWTPALLIAALPQADSQEKLRGHLRFFLREENGRSVFKQLNKMLEANARLGVDSPLYRFLWKSADLTNGPDLLVPMLSTVRNAYHINDSHPLYGIIFELIKNSRQHDPALRTVFKMSGMPEFKDTLKMASRLAKNGELKSIVKVLADLFHRYSLQGASEIAKKNIPAPEVRWKHQLSARDLETDQLQELLRAPFQDVLACGPCGDLNYSLSLDRFWEGEDYQIQLSRFTQCMSPELELTDANSIWVRKKTASAVNWLRNQPLSGVESIVPPATAWSGTISAKLINHFDLLVDLFRLFSANSVVQSGSGSERDSAALSFLVDRIKSKLESAQAGAKSDIQRVLSGMSFWIQNRVAGAAIEVLGPIYRQKRDQLVRILDFVADEISANSSRGDMFPALALYVNEARKGLDSGISLPSEESLSRFNYVRSPRDAESEAELLNWQVDLYKAECIQSVPPGLIRKDPNFVEKLKEYDEAYNSWSKPKYSWEKNELKDAVSTLLQRYAQSEAYHARAGGQSASSRLLSVLRDFSKDVPGGMGNYSTKFFGDWVHDRSVDQYKILYFYPGEKKARLRVVSSLDLLEMVLLDADFKVQARNAMAEKILSLFAGKNFAIKFLGDIGKSWGDEPRESWPEEIKQLYPDGKSPTLRETFEDIIGTLNRFALLVYPDSRSADPYDALTGCSSLGAERGRTMKNSMGDLLSKLALTGEELHEVKRRMFNLAQVIKVIAWNLPASGWCSDYQEYDCHGKEYLADGAKVLRNFFFHIYAANEAVDGRGPFHPQYKIDDQKNTLNIMTQMVRLGLIRQVSRQVTQFSERRAHGHRAHHFKPSEAYYHFVRSLMQAVVVKNPKTGKFYADEIVGKLLSPDEITGARGLDGSLLWTAISRVFVRLEKDSSLSVRHSLKALPVYGIQWVGTGPSGLNLVPEVVSILADVLDRDIDLLKQPERLDWWLNSPRISGALERLYQTDGIFYESGSQLESYGYECDHQKQLCWKKSPHARLQLREIAKRAMTAQLHRSGLDLLRVAQTVPAWNEWVDRWDGLDQAENSRGEKYRDLNLSELVGDLLIFFSAGPETRDFSPAWDASARLREHLRLLLADSGYADLGLRLVAQSPREVNHEILETLDTAIETRQIDELIGFLNRALKQSTVDVR